MSGATLYSIDLEDISTGKQAPSITTRAASEDAARRIAEEEVIQKSPNLRIVAVHSATATAAGIGAAAATGEVVSADRSDLYDDDILLWSEHQAELLRRRAAGELVSDAEIDWPNVAEEIEDVGRSQRNSVESHLVQALLHDLKAEAWPLSRDVPHWRAEARGQRDEARRRFSPSMAQRIDVAKLYREALRRMPDMNDNVPPLPVPDVCPVTLDELLSDD
jgi:hypothetical protein